jgi:hypothetical protein
MERIETSISGGCQCGAVRYHTTAMLDNAHICHCRMCQKSVGNLFAALVAAPRDALVWTRGTPAEFESSDGIARGFCAQCGTPLFYDRRASSRVNLTMGSLDNPAQFPPLEQFGTEARVGWFSAIANIADGGTTEATMPGPAASIKASNHQHPDHDTACWPPRA